MSTKRSAGRVRSTYDFIKANRDKYRASGRRDGFTTASWCRSARIPRCSDARDRTQEAQRVQQRDDDGRDEWRLSENAGNLNLRNGYCVFR
jgi:hypothetical protein